MCSMEKVSKSKWKHHQWKFLNVGHSKGYTVNPNCWHDWNFIATFHWLQEYFSPRYWSNIFKGGNQHNKGRLSFVRDARKVTQCVGAGLDTRQGDTYLSASAWWLWKRWTFPPAGLCTERADSQRDRVTAETWPHILSMVLHPLSCLPFSGECCRGTQHSFIVHHWLNVIHG